MRAPSKRRAKKMLKRNLRKTKFRKRIKILRTVGRTWIIEPQGKEYNNKSLACTRYWSYAAIASNHEKVDQLIAESRNYGKLGRASCQTSSNKPS